MKLYTSDFAPNPLRLAYFIKYKGIEIETQLIDLRKGEQDSESFKAINPNSTIPVLVLDDGTTLTDAISICLYLESLYPDKPLLGTTPLQQAQIVGWDHTVFMEGLAAVAEMVRNQGEFFVGRALPGVIKVEQIPALLERGEKRLQGFWLKLERHISGRQYFVAGQLSLVDIDVLVLIYFAAWVEKSIPVECSELQGWYQRVNEGLGEL